MKKQDLIQRYSAPVPRYTSYPTAPHFNDGITADVYRTWLEAIPAGEPLSLYFHIPYCDTLCWFCGCHTKITRRYAPVSDYLQALLREIELVGAVVGKNNPVKHIHWGGGSPTILEPRDTLRLADHTAKHFHIASDAEFAVEIDPRGLDALSIRALADAGVTRASIGIQDIDPTVQMAINRVQPFGETAGVIDNLRAEGILAINVDLMYGLPHQKAKQVQNTVETVAALLPSRIALFGYAHVPWMKSHQCMIDERVLPNESERLKQAEAASKAIRAAGYTAIGLDHFALPDDPLAVAYRNGTLRRNFQGYTTDMADCLIGFGASAIGVTPSGYVQNEPSLHEYKRRVDTGELPISKGVAVTAEDDMRRTLIHTLMCNYEVDLADLLTRHDLPVDHLDEELTGLHDLEEDGIVERRDRLVTITPRGRPFVRVVCARFDAYLKNGRGRHSAAV